MPQADSNPAQRGDPPDRWWTVPNALCLVRLVGSLGLVWLACAELNGEFLVTYLLLASTDWFDGKIARLLDQRSRIGPLLDTVSDVTMYGAVLFGTIWLFVDRLRPEVVLLSLAVTTYLASGTVSLIKFRRWPSYHTRSAKIGAFAVLLAVVALFMEWSIWPLRIACVIVTLANLEATLLTVLLASPRRDVSSLREVLRD